MSDIPKITLLKVLKSKNKRDAKFGFCPNCKYHNDKYVRCRINPSCFTGWNLIYKINDNYYYRE